MFTFEKTNNMKAFIPILSIIIFSCNPGKGPEPGVPQTNVPDSIKILQTANGAAINLIDGFEVSDTVSDFILFPLKTKDAKGSEESLSSYSKGSGEGNMYWNIVFHNYKTGENTLLAPERKILIGGFNYNGSDYSSEPAYSAGRVETFKKSPLIFYTIYTDDYNGDKKLATDDPAYFFISNTDGTGLKQLSPSNISITQKSFPKNNSFLLLEGLRDSNNDKKFDDDDDIMYYKVNMADSALTVTEIFNASFKITLKKLFDKNWKNK